MFNEYIKPLIVLTAICLVFSAALAFVNSVTAPEIAAASEVRAQEAMREILPNATGFIEIDLGEYAEIPKTIREAYGTENDIGYVFIAATTGYSGEIRLICAVDNSGKIINVQTLSHTETQGIGTIIEQESFLGQFTGADSGLADVDTVTGATVSTRPYIAAVRDVLYVFEAVK